MPVRTLALAAALLAACATNRSLHTDDPRVDELLAAQRRGDWALAERLAADWLRTEPDGYDPLVSLGQALVETGRPAEAVGPLRKALKVHDWAAARLWLGRALADSGEVTEAEVHLREGIRKYPRLPWPAWVLAGVLASQARCAEALQAIEMGATVHGPDWARDERLAEWRACARWPHAPDAILRYGRGMRLGLEGRWEEAVGEYEAALAISPGFADCHRRLGMMAERRGEPRRAEREYRAAIAGYAAEEAPLAQDARARLAGLLLSRERPAAAEAVSLLSDVAAGAEATTATLGTLAQACDLAGEVACSRSAYARMRLANERARVPAQRRRAVREQVEVRLAVLGCRPGEGNGPPPAEDGEGEAPRGDGCAVPVAAARHCEEGRRLYDEGQRDAAVSALEAAVALAPGYRACWHRLAMVLDDLERTPAAEAAYRRAIDGPAGALPQALRAFAQSQLASLLIRAGVTREEVVDLARQGRAVLRDDPFAVLVLGRACEVTGDRTCAVEAFRKVLAVEDAPADLRERAAQRLRVLGVKDAPPAPRLPGSDI